MDKAKIGKFLKQLREEKHKTQYQVAMDLTEYYIDISDRAIAKWEKGNFPDLDNIDKIANYYGVKASEILNGERYLSQDFEDIYFIVNNEWLQKYDANNLFLIRIEQERKIKHRVKELFIKLVKNKSLTHMENEELNFLLSNFYSISRYAKKADPALEKEKNKAKQVKILRRRIYRDILSMHECSNEEIYWEIKKYYDYDKRVTFDKTICNYEDDIAITEKLVRELDDWEKDLLLAQVQTQNIVHSYGRQSKLTYYRHFHKEYDEGVITKEGIKLLIRCGAQVNPALLGYKYHEQRECEIAWSIKDLYKDIPQKLLAAKIGAEDGLPAYYWVDNTLKNRLLDLYYALNLSANVKLSLDEVYNIFINNDVIPQTFLLVKAASYFKEGMSEKEKLWRAEEICLGEIAKWNKAKKREQELTVKQEKLKTLERLWQNGKRMYLREEDKWIGCEKDVLTERDIIDRLSQMSYEQFIESRSKELTEALLASIDDLSLMEIRQRYFPIEVRHE